MNENNPEIVTHKPVSVQPEEKAPAGQNGGYRPNSGRKKGQLAQKTIDNHKALAGYRKKVNRITDKLFNAQAANALGNTFLMKLTTTGPVIVTDQDEIMDFFSSDKDDEKFNGHYYYITTKRPDNKAIDSMLDRTHGKAQQNIDLTTDNQPIDFVSPRVDKALDGLFDTPPEEKEEVDDEASVDEIIKQDE